MKTAIQSVDELHPVPGRNLVRDIYCPPHQEGAPYLFQDNLFSSEQHSILTKMIDSSKTKGKYMKEICKVMQNTGALVLLLA